MLGALGQKRIEIRSQETGFQLIMINYDSRDHFDSLTNQKWNFSRLLFTHWKFKKSE